MLRILRDMAGFLWHRKKLWLVPIVIALMLVGVLILVGEASPLSPFIYSFF